MAQRLRPIEAAQALQFFAGYAPELSLDSDTPDRAPALVLAKVCDPTAGFPDYMDEIVRIQHSNPVEVRGFRLLLSGTGENPPAVENTMAGGAIY